MELEELERLLRTLRARDPRPGAGQGSGVARVIAPDLVAEPGPEGWSLRIEGSQLPTLSVDPEAPRTSAEGARDPAERRWRAARLERARQLFYWCLVNKISVEVPGKFESDFNASVRAAGKR